jgi:hypothetical protein
MKLERHELFLLFFFMTLLRDRFDENGRSWVTGQPPIKIRINKVIAGKYNFLHTSYQWKAIRLAAESTWDRLPESPNAVESFPMILRFVL